VAALGSQVLDAGRAGFASNGARALAGRRAITLAILGVAPACRWRSASGSTPPASPIVLTTTQSYAGCDAGLVRQTIALAAVEDSGGWTPWLARRGCQSLAST
jgi:hypothetical protein